MAHVDYDERLRAREAEEGIIGALLMDNSAFEDVRGRVSASDFHDVQLGQIYATVERLIGTGHSADMVTVSSAGHPPALLAKTIGLASLHAPDYADIIIDRSMRRQAINESERLVKAVFHLEKPVNEALAEAQTRMTAIGSESHEGASTLALAAGELWDRLDGLSAGVSVAIPTPWDPINTLIGGLIPPEFTIVAARPSMGKTQFLVQLAEGLSQKGLKVLVHDLETDKVSWVRRLALMRSGVDWMKFRLGIQTTEDIARLNRAVAKLMQETGIWIFDRTVSVGEFRHLVRRERSKHGVDVVIVDYLQRYPTPGKNRVTEVGEISKTLKDIALENNIPVVAAAQLRRVEDREDKEPTMADLRESGQLEQDADLVLAMHRPAYYNPMLGKEDGSGPTKFIVLKARDGVRGTHTNLAWLARELRFEGVKEDLQRVMGERGIATDKRPTVGGAVSVSPNTKVDDGLRVAPRKDLS